MERHLFWPNRSFVAFDTETTGLDFDNDRIIQAAIAVFVKGQHVWSFDWLLNTKRESEPEAVAIHNITDEQRWKEGEDSLPVMQHLIALFRRSIRANCPVVAFNSPFDFTMFRREIARFHLDFDMDGLHIIDPLVLDRHFQKNVPVFTAPYMRQCEMAARYGLSIPTHDALQDAICAGNIALAQSIHYSGIRNVSPLELERKQLAWHDEFKVKVENFARRKNIQFSIPQWPFGD
jgi:DNA polymerase-3 subunit epsilon